MLIDVATRISKDTGLHIVQQRSTIIDLLNSAALEMYNRLEANKLEWEVTLAVPPNKIITLPSYIGEVRGMRRCTSETVIYSQGMSSPKYAKQDWSYRWNNWRDLGEMSIVQNPSLIGKLVITVPVVESTPVTLLISGQTSNALRIEEEILINAQSKQTINLFGPQIYNIACLSNNRTCDITISDYNGVFLATLYNMDRQTRYKMFDVSEAPFVLDSGDNCLIDVLYKVPLRILSKDSDNFPATSNYDNAWYWMAMWLYYKPMQNKPTDYETFLGNALIGMSMAKTSSEGELEKKFTFSSNKYYNNIGTGFPTPWAITNIDRA